ncbi:MAG: TatD family hydrolase [Chlamydiota bacterium]|nr:TatD family hydrolase [Chlamydiota bacterium]
MPANFLDSHAHLTSDAVFEKVDTILDNAKEVGVTKIVNICTDLVTLERGLKLAKKYPWVYNTASTTPHDVDKEGETVFPVVEKHARAGDLCAIGETGLDYYYDHSKPETQQLYLRKYLRLALECNLPVVIHCREAFQDFFTILDEEYIVNGRHAPGVLHCFTGTLDEAKEVIKRGWFLSLSGIVTFKKSEELREVAKIVPLEQLLIETDTPYLAPQSKRGKPNEPAYVAETATKIAEVKGISIEELAKQTKLNAEKLFKI